MIPREGVERSHRAPRSVVRRREVIPREGVESNAFSVPGIQTAGAYAVIPREGVERSEIVRNGVLDHPEMPHHGAKHRPFALSCREELLSPI